MALKGYSTFPIVPELEPHHRMQFNVILRTHISVYIVYSCSEVEENKFYIVSVKKYWEKDKNYSILNFSSSANNFYMNFIRLLLLIYHQYTRYTAILIDLFELIKNIYKKYSFLFLFLLLIFYCLIKIDHHLSVSNLLLFWNQVNTIKSLYTFCKQFFQFLSIYRVNEYKQKIQSIAIKMFDGNFVIRSTNVYEKYYYLFNVNTLQLKKHKLKCQYELTFSN